MNWTDLNLPIADPTWIFLIVLGIILFAPMLFNKLRIPNIIGMILAGVLIGEHGLNILARDSSFELFGNVGLYYIMFLAGLEINTGNLKKNRNKTLVLGALAFLIPLILGLIVNTSYLKYGFATSLLLASMCASYTLVSYPIVLRLGVSKQRSVSITVGATAITDTLTLIVLAVVSGIFSGTTGGLFLVWLIVKVLAVGALIIYCFPRLARWFFRKYDDTVMQFLFVLVLLFLAAGLMEIAGLEGILGAFIAGILLNRFIPGISPLKNHIEFVGNVLFIPYFLIGVGMLINLKVIFGGGGALKVALIMMACALTGKWLACLLTQKIFGMKAVERRLMYGLSTSQAAATLAAALVGYNIVLPDGNRLFGGLRHKQRQRLGDGPADDHHREAQIDEKVNAVAVGGNLKGLQDFSEKNALLFPKEDAAVFGEAAEEGLLLFDAQNGNPVLFPVAAGEEKAPDGVVPAQGGVLHEALRIGHDFGLLEVEDLRNQILFGREKGVKKAARDADGFINLPDGGAPDALLCHQGKPRRNQGAANLLALLLRVGNFGQSHALLSGTFPKIKTIFKNSLYLF